MLANGFVLIRLFGLPGAIALAGAVNVLVGAGVWHIAQSPVAPSRRPDVPPAVPVGPERRTDRSGYRVLLVAALVTGAASFCYEIAWTRMLSLVLGSATHSFELMLSTFILGLALGGLWVRSRIQRTGDVTWLLARVQIVMGALALLSLPVYGQSFRVVTWLVNTLPHTSAGYALFNLSGWGIALVVMVPTTFCAGMTLPLLTQAALERTSDEASIGAICAANTVGAIAGIFLAVHLGLPLLGLKGLMLAGAGLDIALGLALLGVMGAASARLAVRGAAAGLGLASLAAAGIFVDLDALLMESAVYRYGKSLDPKVAKVLFHRDGKTATIGIVDDGTFLSIRTNGKPDATIGTDLSQPLSTDEPTMILLGAIPLSLNPRARTAANIGFGSGLTTETLLQQESLETVDTIEIEPVVVEAAQSFRPRVERAYADPRSRLHIDDAKSFFAARGGSYDIIVAEPSNPWVSGVASLFSVEFYETVRRHLAETGVFCQWLQLYEIDEDLVVSVLKALSGVFEDFAVYAASDSDLVIVAGKSGVLPAAELRSLSTELRAGLLWRIGVASNQDLLLRRVADKRMLGAFLASSPVPANSDYHPILDQNAASARFRRAEAKEFFSTAFDPLPLGEMLMNPNEPPASTNIRPAPYFQRAERSARAMLQRDFLLESSPVRLELLPAGPTRQNTARLEQLFSSRCDAAPQERINAFYETLALEMIPHLSAVEMEAVWKRLETGGCVRFFTAREHLWIELFRAVGRRDAGAMATTARRLLESERDLPPGLLNYVVAAGMLGSVARGENGETRRLWERYRAPLFGQGQPSALFRMLVAGSTGP